MSVVKILDDVTAWAQKEICDRVKLKAPPDDDNAPVDEGYEYTLVNPTAFTLFTPTKDKLPPKVISPIPSLCVRFVEGSEAFDGSGGSITMQLMFSTWEVGLHSKDILIPQEDGSFKQWTGAEADAYFRRGYDGWRDAWNFVDVALRAIESRTHVAGYEIDRQSPVDYGPLSEQEAIPDYYPMWFCWVQFTLKYPLVRNVEDIENLL